MALIGPRIKVVTATLTTAGGAGASSGTIAVPAGYKLRTLIYSFSTPTPMDTGATISAIDNGGAGSQRFVRTSTGATGTPTKGTDALSDSRSFDMLAVVTPINLVGASGGTNGKTCEIRAIFYRTRGHA